MQKIFRKYIFIVMSISLITILLINFFLSSKTLQSQQIKTFNLKIDQVIRTIENNQIELESLKSSLDEDYLTRARAFAYVIEKNPSIIESVSELKELATLLDVDELHVSDSNGIIAYSSVSQYVGLDFHDGEQMRAFLPILESDDPNKYIIQEAQPNTAEGKIMKYVGVARKEQKGIVQVGLEPIRQLEAQQRNTYSDIFSKFPTSEGEKIFAIEKTNNQLVACTEKLNKKEITNYTYSNLKNSNDGKFININNDSYFFVTKEYNDILIGAAIPKDILYQDRATNFLTTGTYLILIEIIVVLSINVILNKKVINGIHNVINDLDKIKNGDLNVVVKANDNQELIELSSGINSMLKSIINSTDHVSKIISIIDIPLAAFEYQHDSKQFFATARIKELLHLTNEEFIKLYNNPNLFLDRIKQIIKLPIADESDIYNLKNNIYLQIHLIEDDHGFYGTINDVSQDIIKKQQIEYEKDHDHLTGLLLYPSFKKLANKLIKQTTIYPYATVMIDLDNFKHINDTYGHAFGDFYLKIFTLVLNKLPQNNCIIARRSGDEFCIFIYNYPDEQTIYKLLNTLWFYLKKEVIELPDHTYQSIEASGGYVCDHVSNNDIDILMNKADIALYEAKNFYKGSFIEYHDEQKTTE